MKEISVAHALIYLRRYKWRLLAAVLIPALIAFAFCLWLIPQYAVAHSSVAFTYNTDKSDRISTASADMEASFTLTQAFISYMDEDFLLENAAANLPAGLSRSYTAEELRQAISVTVGEETLCFRYKVSLPNAQDALALCDFYADYSMNTVIHLTRIGQVKVIEHAYLDERTEQPISYSMAALYCVLGALALVALFVFLRLALFNKIPSVPLLQERFRSIPVLGAIPAMAALLRPDGR